MVRSLQPHLRLNEDVGNPRQNFFVFFQTFTSFLPSCVKHSMTKPPRLVSKILEEADSSLLQNKNGSDSWTALPREAELALYPYNYMRGHTDYWQNSYGWEQFAEVSSHPSQCMFTHTLMDCLFELQKLIFVTSE